MNDKSSVIEISVDRGKKFFVVGFGSGDGSGKIDKRQGRGKRFIDPVAAMDTADMWKAAINELLSHYPSAQRPVRIIATAAVWAALEEEGRRLKAELKKDNGQQAGQG